MEIIKETINIHHYLRNKGNTWDLFLTLRDLVKRFNRIIAYKHPNINPLSISIDFSDSDEIDKIVLRYTPNPHVEFPVICEKVEIVPYTDTKINTTRILEFISEVSRSYGLEDVIVLLGDPIADPRRPAYFTFFLDRVKYEYYLWSP